MNNILIVGLGLIGGSYAKRLSKIGYQVTGFDINTDVLNDAFNDGVISNNKVSSINYENVDLVVLCLYPTDNVNWLNKYQNKLKSNTIITDVTGTKVKFVSEVNKIIRNDLIFIPTHPMAGREVSGYYNSSSDLFNGANFIITPLNNHTDLDVIKKLGNDLGCSKISVLSIEEHDEIIGYLSHLTHVIACCLMQNHDFTNFINYTGDSFRDLTRIAKINSSLWSKLFIENKDVLVSEIDKFKETLTLIQKDILNEDIDSIVNFLETSKENRILFDKK